VALQTAQDLHFPALLDPLDCSRREVDRRSVLQPRAQERPPRRRRRRAAGPSAYKGLRPTDGWLGAGPLSLLRGHGNGSQIRRRGGGSALARVLGWLELEVPQRDGADEVEHLAVDLADVLGQHRGRLRRHARLRPPGGLHARRADQGDPFEGRAGRLSRSTNRSRIALLLGAPTPKGWRARKGAAGLGGARKRLRRRNPRLTVVGSAQGGGTGRAAPPPRALAARRLTARLKEPRGHLSLDDGARRGQGGRPLRAYRLDVKLTPLTSRPAAGALGRTRNCRRSVLLGTVGWTI
jgi:hypothetical protein